MKHHARTVPIRYDSECSLGLSPTRKDIERLARRAGFRALLNLNEEGEPGEVLSPNVEASWAHTFEMQHERVSFPTAQLDPVCVDRFLRALRGSAKPVYVHSLGGHRAAAMMTIQLGLAQLLRGADAVRTAKALGIDSQSEVLERFAIAEIDRRIDGMRSA